jgi:ribosomal protein S18 acetylase RimI-like enzyme
MKKKMSNYITKELTKSMQNELSPLFECGNQALTLFLKSYDSLDNFFGKTYIMLDESKNRIIGYYNISTGHIEDENHIRTGGTVYINCLALDVNYQKKKIGSYYISDRLLCDCLKRIENIRKEIGFGFVTLSSTDEGLKLYERNGFCELEDDMLMAKNTGEDACIPMYLPLDYE